MKDFSSKVLCISLSASCLGTTSTDVPETEHVAARNNGSTRQLRAVRKILCNRPKGLAIQGIAPIQKLQNAARTFWREHTSPGITGDARLGTPKQYEAITAEIETLRTRMAFAVETLSANWEEELAYDASPNGLGDRFDPGLYPAKSQLADHFKINLVAVDFPKGDYSKFGFLADGLKAQHEEMVTRIGLEARNEIRAKLAERLRQIIAKMEDEDAEKFHESTFTNLRDLLELVPDLNITEDPVIEEVRADCLHRLNFKMETVKKSWALRQSVAGQAKDILAKLGGTGRRIIAA